MAQYTKVIKITPQEAKRLKEVAKNAEFVPVTPIPRVFDPQKRIEQLRTYLDPRHPNFEFEEQHVNIRALIKLYEEGEIVDNSQDICIRDGKIITAEEMKEETGWAWIERRRCQKAQKFAYGHGSLGPDYHELRMLLRLAPEYRGDETAFTTAAMNDTGSNTFTVFRSDLQRLGKVRGYRGWRGDVELAFANGDTDTYRTIIVEVCLLRDDNSQWSDWIREDAVVVDDKPGLDRLSGAGIRQELYFGTARGNDSLAVAKTRGGLYTLLK